MRLFYIFRYPVESYSSNNDSRLSQYISAPDISLFIKTRKKLVKVDKKSKTNQSLETINEENYSENYLKDDDIFGNNPNNIFFNQSLQMINNEANTTL